MTPNLFKHAMLAIAGVVAVTSTAIAQDVPVIHYGRATAAEENIWLMIARPDLAKNLGKAYKIDWSVMRASDTAFKALESGQIDMASVSGIAAILAASKGLDFKIVASISRESINGAHTYYLVKAKDGPQTIADLKGSTCLLYTSRCV